MTGPTSSTPNMTVREPTAEELAIQQERQDDLDAGTGIEDTDAGNRGGGNANPDDGGAPAEPEPGQRVVIQKSPSDVARDQIAKRFRREEETPFNGDMTDQGNLYGDVARTLEEPDDGSSIVGERMETQPPAATEPAKKTYTIKVRGKDVTLTEDEILERASKVEAADSYLAESREILDGAKAIRAERASSDLRRPEGQNGAQDDGLNHSDPDDGQRPGPDFKSVVEKIQFGDPEEAARELQTLIDQRASSKANEGHIARLFNNDLAKSQQALRDFEAKNPTLANDKIAAVVLEQTMYDIYREDIQKLGVVDEAQIPTDPKTLANWHRFYRVNGHDVRSTPDALNEAKARYENWRGVSAPAATQGQQPKPAAQRQGAPRINVNVDRTERRAAIPNQPSRSAAPRPNQTTQAQTRADPSDTIAKMRRARGQV